MWKVYNRKIRRFLIRYIDMKNAEKLNFSYEEIYCNEKEIDKIINELSKHYEYKEIHIYECMEIDWE